MRESCQRPSLNTADIEVRAYAAQLDYNFISPRPWTFSSNKIFPSIYSLGKRLLDIVVALTALILTSPLFLLIALLIKFKSPGSVFFCHERLGLHGQPFKCWKFRTMVPNAEEVLKQWLEHNPSLRQEFMKHFKLKEDPRIIPKIGDFLRRTSLDELPQFINVLKGEMSVVGPRPIVQKEVEFYGDRVAKFFSVKPGITGLWQVSGRNDIDYNDRIRLELKYVDKQSFFLDLAIIFKTTLLFLKCNHNGY